LASDWITINEPWCIAYLGHSWGVQAPGLKDEALAIKTAHHVLLAHGLALREFRNSFPEAKVGISNILGHSEPKTDSAQDIEASARLDTRMNKLFLDPVFKGVYGDDVLQLFTKHGLNGQENAAELVKPGDLNLISQPNDFVGINHYHNMVASHKKGEADEVLVEQATPNHQSSWNWPNTPWALEKILGRVNSEYTKLPIYITENGITLNDYSNPEGQVHDPDRIDYLNGYLGAVGDAIRSGVPVQGYFAWSFLDNFEWAEGYDKRFGLVYVDFPTQTRIPKSSAYWYQSLISKHHEKVAQR
jgi:beta-glucosidase